MLKPYLLKAKRILTTGGALLATLMFSTTISGSAALAATTSTVQMKTFQSAAQEFGVPVDVLLAISYNQTNWQGTATASANGGFGPMDLRTRSEAKVSGRDGKVMNTPQTDEYYTLDRAAQLLHMPAHSLKTDAQANIRGGAAVLAEQARQLHNGKVPTNQADWYDVVAKFSGLQSHTAATTFADAVFQTMKAGVSGTTTAGQNLHIDAHTSLQANKNLAALGLSATSSAISEQSAECPATLTCHFIPAAYHQNNPQDPSDYGNYDIANRPADLPIKYIYIHDTEGSYQSAIAHFQDPSSYVSSQYIVSKDGDITQMVRNKDVSWGVYNWYDNMHGINIETEGFAAQSASFTPAMYQKEAQLVRWLAEKYHIPLDRQHIIGHDNIPVTNAAHFPYQHNDPGPYWNWTYFMDLVKGMPPEVAQADSQNHTIWPLPIGKGNVVTVAPSFATNKPTVTNCSSGMCETLPTQGANFVYLHTQPSNSSPLLNDPYAHLDSSITAGTTDISDWGDRAPAGFKYVVADVKGDWVGIWFSGKVGWLYNPPTNRTVERSLSFTISPKAGVNNVAVYGGPFPDASEYPADVPAPTQSPLYKLASNQSYTTSLQELPTDYFYAMTIDSSLPRDHTIIYGKQKYYQIVINQRIGYVKANEVNVGFK